VIETVDRPEQIGLMGTDPRNENKVFDWISDVSWPDKDVMVCRDALPFIADLIAPAEEHGRWRPSTVMDGGSEYEDHEHRSSDRLTLTGPDLEIHESIEVYGVMLHSVEGWFVKHYMNHNRFATVERSSGYEMLRYGPGQRFGEHVDVVRDTVLAGRRLSVVAFCNDDFEGGDLVFPRQGLRIRPEPGMLVLFPSGIAFPHEAEPVKTGTRYAIVSWYF